MSLALWLSRWVGNGQAVAAWPMPDFLPRPRRIPTLAWLVLSAAALLLSVGALQLWQQMDERQAQDAAKARWLAELRRLEPNRTQPRAAAAPDKAARQAGLASLRAAQQVDQALRHRWDLLLQGVEASPASRVQWLRLEHDARRGQISLEGLAPTRDEALRQAEHLASAPGWGQVQLSRVDAGVAGLPARFEVRALLGSVQGSGLLPLDGKGAAP